MTVEAVTAQVDTIKTALGATVTSLQGLVGEPIEVILASVDGTAQVTDVELGKVVAGLVTVSRIKRLV